MSGKIRPAEGAASLQRIQLLANGIDLRTVAGRLGHSGGGVTTLKFYAQFVRPADQQAAAMLSNQLAELRKKEHLWELFSERPLVDLDRLDELASTLGEAVSPRLAG